MVAIANILFKRIVNKWLYKFCIQISYILGVSKVITFFGCDSLMCEYANYAESNCPVNNYPTKRFMKLIYCALAGGLTRPSEIENPFSLFTTVAPLYFSILAKDMRGWCSEA